MARVFVKDPETGKPAIEVTNYQVVEMDDLQTAITDLTAQRDAKNTEVENALETANVMQAELESLEAQLQDAKSEFEAAQTVVADPAEGLDTGADADGSEVETPAEDSGEVEEAPVDASVDSSVQF